MLFLSGVGLVVVGGIVSSQDHLPTAPCDTRVAADVKGCENTASLEGRVSPRAQTSLEKSGNQGSRGRSPSPANQANSESYRPSGKPKLTTPHEAQTTAFAASPKAAADFPVIGYLEQRERTITIKAGPNGPLYSVKTADGKVLCENLPADQLRAQAPELGEFLKGAIAGMPGVKGDARGRVWMDAGMRNSAMR